MENSQKLSGTLTAAYLVIVYIFHICRTDEFVIVIALFFDVLAEHQTSDLEKYCIKCIIGNFPVLCGNKDATS